MGHSKQAAIVEDAKANLTMEGIGFWSIHVLATIILSYSLIRLTVIKISDVYLFQMKAKGQTRTVSGYG